MFAERARHSIGIEWLHTGAERGIDRAIDARLDRGAREYRPV
jgi:hypothetical protein